MAPVRCPCSRLAALNGAPRSLLSLCRLREAREQSDRDHVEEVDMYRKTNDNLKAQVEAVHSDLSVRQVGRDLL